MLRPNGSTLTLTSSVAGGSIEGGKANNGGAAYSRGFEGWDDDEE